MQNGTPQASLFVIVCTQRRTRALRNSGSIPEHGRHWLSMASWEEVYSGRHSYCHGQLPFPLCSAHNTQSTTANIYSPPEEMLPAAKTNHFTAPAACLIRHICLSFSQAWSVGKASKGSKQHLSFSVSVRSCAKKDLKQVILLSFSYLKMRRKVNTWVVSLLFSAVKIVKCLF